MKRNTIQIVEGCSKTRRYYRSGVASGLEGIVERFENYVQLKSEFLTG